MAKKEEPKIVLQWEETRQVAEELATRLRRTRKLFSGLVPIPRGGLIPAAFLSYSLGIPIKDRVETELDVIVDEIVDTGSTYLRWRKQYPRNTFACLFLNVMRFKAPPPPIHAQKVTVWVQFPWETSEK